MSGSTRQDSDAVPASFQKLGDFVQTRLHILLWSRPAHFALAKCLHAGNVETEPLPRRFQASALRFVVFN